MADTRSSTSGSATQTRDGAYTTRPLDVSTWDAFAELVERNNGVYGGCWCIGFHTEYQRGVSDPRTLEEQLVKAGRAHAALVFDRDGVAQGWCQYGSPDELGLKHQREHLKDPPPRADWRITCIFADKRHRGQGVARAALEGALAAIAAAGGGRVEAISEVTAGREAQGRFLFSATVELFEQHGFARGRQVGKHAWIVSRRVDPRSRDRVDRLLYARPVVRMQGRLGTIAGVVRVDTPALSRDVPLDLPAIQAAWPVFESEFDSLQGRRMMGLVDDRTGTYRLSCERLPRDEANPLGLDETTIPGGAYLRLRLVGEAPGVYDRIAAAFDELFEHADHDPNRPLIEFYRREGEVDCLVPVRAAAAG